MAVALVARAISLSRIPAAAAIGLQVSRWKLSPGRVTHPAKMSLSRSARTVTQAALASTALAILAVSESALRRAVTAQPPLYVVVVCGRRSVGCSACQGDRRRNTAANHHHARAGDQLQKYEGRSLSGRRPSRIRCRFGADD